MMARGEGRRGLPGTSSRATRWCGALVSSVVVGFLASCAGAPEPEASAGAGVDSATDGFPVTIENCGREITFSGPPERVVTMNHAATEMMLALGLDDRVVGAAGMGPVPERWEEASESITTLTEKDYPSREVFFAAGPDFAYATEHSAFTSKDVGTREELADQGVLTYKSPIDCSTVEKGALSSFPTLWGEITDIGHIFGVPTRAERLVESQHQTLDRLEQESAGKGITVFWYDMKTKAPFAGAGGGGPQTILAASGATNIFGEINADFESVSWEKVVAADPEVIVLADWPSSSAEKKIRFLESDPALSQLTAVKKDRYITVPAHLTLSRVRLMEGAKIVARGLAGYDELSAR